jgi:integrase
MISTITTPDIEQFLAGIKAAPGTNPVRRDYVTLWSYAIKAGYAAENVAKASERARVIDAPPGILTAEQAAALLTESRDNDLLAFHAIGLFAGLRVSEIKALDWRDVDLAGGYIQVGAKISKTRSSRLRTDRWRGTRSAASPPTTSASRTLRSSMRCCTRGRCWSMRSAGASSSAAMMPSARRPKSDY